MRTALPDAGNSAATAARPSRRFVLRLGMPLLALAAGMFAWQYWRIHYAWRSGYGDESMELFRRADPRVLSGGDLTNFSAGIRPFGQPSSNLPWQLAGRFDDGNGFFDQPMKLPRADLEGQTRAGVGPLYNAVGCAECHFADGRPEKPYETGGEMLGLFVRMSAPDGRGGWQAPPGYNTQLHDRAAAGVRPEGRGRIDWVEVSGRLAGGEAYSLRRPVVSVSALGYGPLPQGTILEVRNAPRVNGLGLVEAVPDDEILARAEANRRRGDAIRGRPNRVTDPVSGERRIGRFSLKANQANLRAQAADAAINDMGMTTSIFPRETCRPNQADCLASYSESAQRREFTDKDLGDLEFYLQFLAVPARRDVDDATVLRGERVFHDIQCAACHQDTLRTGDAHPQPRLRNQTFHPYTDLLLHDMGPDLAGRPDGEAGPNDWRTAPLWGIGKDIRSHGYGRYLHDGRARSPAEAILWHGGEAQGARDAYANLPESDRDALLRFLDSL